MSYTPTTWATGDVITAEKLNNMESGIVNAGNTMVFEFSASSDPQSPGSFIVTTDATYEEVKTAITDGKLCVAKLSFDGDINTLIFDYVGLYSIVAHYTNMYLKGSGTALAIEITKLTGYENDGWSLSLPEYNVAIATT